MFQMLELIRVATPAEKAALFSTFDSRTQSWIVSDLQSKWHLQKTLLARDGVLEDATVMRATELWKHFAFQLRPDLRLLSSELAQTLFWDWIEPKKLPWARSPRAVQVVLRQMQQWMTMFADPQAPEIMAEWFAGEQDAYTRWGHWFELCLELWARCRERNLAMVSWLPALLLSEDLSRIQWDRALVFDLGPQITQVEGLLLREIGKQGAVSAVVPSVPWSGLMRHSLSPYDELAGQTESGVPDWSPEANANLHFGRFSTQLAEVKDAVARVRKWLDAGIEAQRIAVIAPDIEEYWPALRMYFAEEGVAVCKGLTARLGSFTEMARWLADLRTALHKVSADDLELHFFTQQDEPRLSFDEFKILFTHVYDAVDLGRAQALFEGRVQPAAREKQSLQEFLPWALRFWNANSEPARLLSLLQVTGQEVPRETSLLPAQWLSYIEGLLARREMSLRPANESGVWCISLTSANWLEVDHAVILNMSEGALRQVSTSQISASEAQKIFTDTGFALASPDRQELEFEFLWLLERPWRELHLSFAATDFSGSVLTPSRLWMWTAIVGGRYEKNPRAPDDTRWDEIQRQTPATVAALRAWPTERAAGVDFGLRRDTDPLLTSWKPVPEVCVSASSLKSYLECSFKFAAERLLKLNDDPALDLDLDRRTRGNLLHAVVEALLTEPPRWDWSEAELLTLVEQARTAQEIRVGDERLWPAVRAQHVHFAGMFLRFERDWRERFPQTRTIGRETQFVCYWDFEKGEPTSAVTPIMLSGRLDRIDCDSQGRYALIDYKASSQGLTNWDRWIVKRELQMALYAMLLESGLCGVEAAPVMAANYYVVRESDRRKGFHLKDEAAELYSVEEKYRKWMDGEGKTRMFDELRAEIQRAIAGILAGVFRAQPENVKTCERCSWRSLCRAPHLN